MILSILLGCQGYVLTEVDNASVDDTGQDSLVDGGEDDGTWDGAWMEVLSPGSGDFLPLDEASDFEAVVY